MHGGYGYMEEYRICRIYRDVRSLSIFAGTSEIMKLIISRNLGLKA
ncbi:MAG: acyl-CoA dehydrogenase family protein [Desulfobacteraceae bacterium]